MNPSDTEVLYFTAPEQLDTYFREGREFFNETYVKKFAQTGRYMTRVETKMWPMKSGTTSRGFRFGRGWYNEHNPWYRIVSDRCETNSCDSVPEKIKRPGTDSYTYHLLRKEMETDWICVEDLMHRLLPEHEIMQIEDTNARITRAVHEEFIRAHYIGGAGHHWLGLADADDPYCGTLDDAAWFVDEFDDTGEGGYNLKYVRVNIDPAEIDTIAMLTLDYLEDAVLDLQGEDEAYRLDLKDNGIEALDIIVPDSRTARAVWREAKEQGGYWNTDSDFDPRLSKLKLGINRVIGDYAFTYDSVAPKFNIDSVFNATLGAYDASDEATWPRFVRVPRYIETEAEIGYKYIPNPDYKNADFGITVLWVPDKLIQYTRPGFTGFGKVRMEEQDYAGNFHWRRPDWESNPKGKSGFFEAEFNLAAQITDPTMMHVFFTRLINGKSLSTVNCPLNEDYVDPAPISNYVCQGVSA